MESLDVSLRKKDLCEISEYLRRIKEVITYTTMQRILQNAERIHLEKDYIENYIDDYFRDEAANYLTSNVLYFM
jgi:hypothetical protein